MKKLFVLFLLVSLVPFCVGCSLWGNDEDLDVLPVTITAKAVVPTLGLSLRAAVAAGSLYENYTLTIGTTVLSAYTYETVGTNVEITFRAEVTSAQKTAFEATTGVVDLILADGAGKTEKASVNITKTGTITVTVTTVAGVTAITGVTMGTTAVGPDDIATGGTFTIASVKIGANTLSSTAYASATSLLPVFTVTLSDTALVGAVIANVSAKNSDGKTVTLASTDFTTTDAVAGVFTVTVKDAAEPKKLNDTHKYTVTVNSSKVDDKILAAPASYNFVVDLP